MNPLLTAQHASLYRLDSTFMTNVRFSQPVPGSITLIFSEKPDFRLPEEFYLMPDGDAFDFTSYQCTMAGPLKSFYVETTDSTYYTREATTKDTPELRNELRVNVSIDAQAKFDHLPSSVPISIKNISAGGMMFVSGEDLKEGTIFSFTSPLTKTFFNIRARILGKRPTRFSDKFAYNCQFSRMPAKIEGEIRQFVFNEDLMQRKSARDPLAE